MFSKPHYGAVRGLGNTTVLKDREALGYGSHIHSRLGILPVPLKKGGFNASSGGLQELMTGL